PDEQPRHRHRAGPHLHSRGGRRQRGGSRRRGDLRGRPGQRGGRHGQHLRRPREDQLSTHTSATTGVSLVQSISDPLNRFHEDGSWFARAHELRLWVIRCDATLRKSVLDLVPKLEFHADNRSPWPVLPDAHTKADDGWQVRANGLAADWMRRVEAFAKDDVHQGPVAAPQGPTGRAAFRTTAAAILEAMVAPLAGVVV